MSERQAPYEVAGSPDGSLTPTTWLWQEIETRFGKEAADALHRDHNEQLKRYARRQGIEAYRRRLPGMRWQLERRRKEGRGTKALEKSIALAEKRLREAGLEEVDDTRQTWGV